MSTQVVARWIFRFDIVLRAALALVRWSVVALCLWWVLDVLVGGSTLITMNEEDIVFGDGGPDTVSSLMAIYIAGVFVVGTWIFSWIVKGGAYLFTALVSPLALEVMRR